MLGYREIAIVPLSALVIISLLTSRPHMFAVFALLFVVALSWNRCLEFGRRMMQKTRKATNTHKIVIVDLKADALVSLFKPILAISILQRTQNLIENRIKPDILRSGAVENPRLLGIKSVLYMIMAFAISVPAGLGLAILHDMVFITVVFAPALLLGIYFVSLKAKTADRKSAIEDELAPFATMASIMESVNVSLFSTFVMVAKSPSGIFPAMKKEGRRIRDITSLGASPTDALLDLSGSHPNTTFRDFLDGYVSSFNTGGSDTAKYLQDQSRRFFRFMQSKMAIYTRQAETTAQVMLIIMMLLPMMGLSMMFFATGNLAQTMILLMIAVLPFISVVMIGFVQVKQPKNMEKIGISWVMFPVSISCSILVYLVKGQIWEAIGIGVIAGCFTNMVFVRKEFSRSSAMEAALPEFMRQMTRFRNIGMDMIRAIKTIRDDIIYRQGASKPPKFNHTFDELIDTIYRKMATGRSLEWAVAGSKMGFWNARLVFLMLGKVHESGGGTSKTLDSITRWVTEYADAKKEMTANLRASLMTAFVGPVLMVMMSAISDRMALEFEKSQAHSSYLENAAIGAISISADTLGLSEVLTITAVVCMGVVLSKINYFSVKHTLFTGVITAVTMGLLYAVPYLPEF